MTNPNTSNYKPLTKVEAYLVTIFLVILCILSAAGTYFVMFRLWPLKFPPLVCIEFFSLSNYTSSNRRISATWDVRFRVHSEDMKHMPSTAFNDVVSTVLYKDLYLAQVEIPPFVMAKGNDSVLQARLKTVDYFVDDWVVDGINGEMANGAVKVNFEFTASWSRGWTGGEETVQCNEIVVSAKTGKMLGPQPKYCDD